MDFEQFSEKYKKIKSPDANQATDNSSHEDSSGLMELLMKEDIKSKKVSRRFYIIYGIGGVLYFLLFIANPDPQLTIRNRIAGTCFVVAFAVLGILFWKNYSEINKSMYLNSPRKFLIAAKKRFSFWNKKQLWLIPVVLLINLGSSISISRYYGNLSPIIAMGIFQFVFWGTMIYGFFKGKQAWIKNKKPIFLKIDKMLAGFEE